LWLSSGIDRIFLAISLLINAPYEFFKLLIILQTTPNDKFNYLKPINCWFYFIFNVFVYKMAIIHLESSRNWRILRRNSFVSTIGVNQLSAILNYRRHFVEEMIWLALTLLRPASNWLICPRLLCLTIGVTLISALPKYRRYFATRL
jgi:hypothetical protein